MRILFFLCLVLFHPFSWSAATSPETENSDANEASSLPQQRQYDQVKVLGHQLEGKLISFDTQSITFETRYGQGRIRILYQNIEDLSSLAPFYFHTTNESFFGRVISYKDGLFVIQNLDGNITLVSPKYVRYGVEMSVYQHNILTRARYTFPFWQGNLGFSIENDVTTIDKLKIRFSLTLERRLAPARYKFDSYINYDEDNTNNAGITTKDERYASFIYELDTPQIASQTYGFIMPAYESDQIRLLNSRWFPSAGIGYRFLNSESSLVQVQTGLSQVVIDYINAEDQSFTAFHLGAEANHQLHNGIILHGSAYYMPSLNAKNKDHLTRMETSVTIPLIDFVRAEIKYILLNDNSPEPAVGNNKQNLYIGLNLDLLN